MQQGAARIGKALWANASNLWTLAQRSPAVAATLGGAAVGTLAMLASVPWTLALLVLLVAVALAVNYRDAWWSTAASRDGTGTSGSARPEGSDPAPGGQHLWREMLTGLTEAALVLDRDRIVLEANAAAKSLLSARPGRDVVHFIRSPEILHALDRAIETGLAQSFETRLAAPVERFLSGRITPLGDRGPGEPAMLFVIRDHTEQQRLAEMRADFVANASHELRTPLASLKGFIETLQGAAKNDPAAQAQFLAIMEQQAGRMTRLIEDLLSLSRIEMHEHVHPSAVVDLAEIVESAGQAMQPLAAKANVHLSISIMARPAKLVGDRDELQQVVQNLVQNAIKYGRRNGTVAVSVRRDGNHTLLMVADDGIGIAPEHVPRLTERFYRVSAKESRERGGTGLGLAIVKHIVNRHRGKLRIDSQPGKGSTFTVHLPEIDNAYYNSDSYTVIKA